MHSRVADVSRWKFLNVAKKMVFLFHHVSFCNSQVSQSFWRFFCEDTETEKGNFLWGYRFFPIHQGLKMKPESQRLQRCGSEEFFSKTDKQSNVFNLILSFSPLDYRQRYVIIHRKDKIFPLFIPQCVNSKENHVRFLLSPQLHAAVHKPLQSDHISAAKY